VRKVRGQSGSPAQCPHIHTVPKGKAGEQSRPHSLPAIGGRRGRYFRLVTAVAAPVVFLAIVELVLILFGFGYPTSFFIPGKDPSTLTPNDWFVWFYHRTPPGSPHPCIVQIEKPADTVRIFVLGESAAMGTPDPAFGVSRILETMLQRQYPGKTVEVINTAVRGINSFLIVDIARECAALSPDAFVVYMGNNEICGLYGPESFLSRHPWMIEPLHQIRRTRISQLISLTIQGHPSRQTSKDKTQTAGYFRQHRMAFDDPRRQVVWDNFESNLQTICRIGRQAGAAVLVSTVASNLEDCPPLGSLHRQDLTAERLSLWEGLVRQGGECETRKDYPAAIESYRSALAIDDHYAELQFRMARSLRAVGKLDQARQTFELARDWDALQFRADSKINSILRQAAADPGVSRIDAETLLSAGEHCKDGILGGEIFSDHVHFKFDGDYELAKVLAPAVMETMKTQRDWSVDPSATWPTRADCARRLAFTAWDEINTAGGMAKATALLPFTDQLDHPLLQSRIDRAVAEGMAKVNGPFVDRVLADYRSAIAAYPQDWMIRYNLATLLYQLQMYPDAAELMIPIAEAFPKTYQYRVCLGYALGQSGRKDLAAAQFRLALKYDSRFKPAKDALLWAIEGTSSVTQSD
jgi:tetratricopeptide (TPR) repeat protein